MQRTLNYTERRRIDQKEALFSFTEADDGIPSFNVKFNLDTDFYPDDADLLVEAHYKETRQRFHFGKISNIAPPENRKLDQLDLTGPTLFRVMIVDTSGHHSLLLASGDQFRGDSDTKEEENKSSLLTVKTSPHLGQITWRIEFDTGGIPELYLNNRIPGAIQKMSEDPLFQSLVLPAALRQILMYFLWNDNEESEYSKRWMTFASSFAENKPEDNDPEALTSWVEDVVAGFSTRFDLCDRLVNSERSDSE